MAEKGFMMRVVGQPPIELLEGGRGAPVVLLHSSASGAHQWDLLIRQFGDRRRVLAPNLLGYGRTDPRETGDRRTIEGQARALIEILRSVEEPIDLVGHSFGGVIALELASALGPRARRVAVFEPNAFALLNRPGCEAEWDTVRRLHHEVRALAESGSWLALAARFANFFSGDGVWAAMPDERRMALAAALRFNPDEWDAVMSPDLAATRWANVKAPVLLAWSLETRAPLRALVDVLLQAFPHWTSFETGRGGHLAPIIRPRPFNAAVLKFLDDAPS